MAVDCLCSVKACDNPVYCRGFCRRHYRLARVENFPECLVDGCSNRSYIKGFCNSHYIRVRKFGSPKGRAKKRAALIAEQKEFIKQALIYQGEDCLVWPWGRYKSGYACIPGDGKSLYGHRYVCAEAHGAAPSDKHEAAHRCGVRPCINPKHLRWATPKENNADKILHGTLLTGDKHPNTKLTSARLKELKSLLGTTSHTALAKKFGVSRSHVSVIASGKRR